MKYTENIIQCLLLYNIASTYNIIFFIFSFIIIITFIICFIFYFGFILSYK